MIKLAARTPLGVPVLFLGLTGENVTRLAAGEPLLIRAADLQEMGLPAVEVAVCYGRTDAEVMAVIRAHGVPVRDGPVPPA